MAKQLAPLLKPPTPVRAGGGGGIAAGPGDRERDALNMPILPVTGFFRRMGAMTFDFLLLWFVQRITAWIMPDVFLANPDLWWHIAGILCVLYFALLDGPLGKGQTPGKMLVGIRVTTLDGGIPTLPQALLRTAALYPGLIVSRGINSWAFAGDTFASSQFAVIGTFFLMAALFVSNIFAIIFNPFKMGMHDYLAKTLVRPSAIAPEPFTALTARIGGDWRRHFLQPQLMGAGTFVIVFGFLLFTQWPTRLEIERRTKFDLERALLREASFPPRTTFQTGGFMPIAEDGGATQEGYQALRRRVEGEDPPGPLTYKLRLAHRGRWPFDAPRTEAIAQQYANLYLHRIFGGFEGSDLGPNWENVSTAALRQSTFTMRVEIVEYFDLLLPAWENPVATHLFTLPPIEVVEGEEVRIQELGVGIQGAEDRNY